MVGNRGASLCTEFVVLGASVDSAEHRRRGVRLADATDREEAEKRGRVR
jgi:hypothetical protein